MTKTEKEKMLAGEPYQAFDDELVQERTMAKKLCFQFNQTCPTETEKRQTIIKKLLNVNDAVIESPFAVDYGYNIHLGKNFYANHGCTLLDGNHITVGDNCLLAPHVCISTASHPLDATKRESGEEWTAAITIGDNVWIGANATILPGVTIDDGAVVAAGAVVNKNVPSNVVVGGVPAKVIKELNEN